MDINSLPTPEALGYKPNINDAATSLGIPTFSDQPAATKANNMVDSLPTPEALGYSEPSYLARIKSTANPQASTVGKSTWDSAIQFGKDVVGAGETALHVASSYVAPVAGLENTWWNQGNGQSKTDLYHEGKDAVTYEPRTESGKEQSDMFGAVMSPVAKVMQLPGKAVEAMGGSQIAGEVTNDVVQTMLPIAKIPGKTPYKLAEGSQALPVINSANKIGIQLTEGQVKALDTGDNTFRQTEIDRSNNPGGQSLKDQYAKQNAQLVTWFDTNVLNKADALGAKDWQIITRLKDKVLKTDEAGHTFFDVKPLHDWLDGSKSPTNELSPALFDDLVDLRDAAQGVGIPKTELSKTPGYFEHMGKGEVGLGIAGGILEASGAHGWGLATAAAKPLLGLAQWMMNSKAAKSAVDFNDKAQVAAFLKKNTPNEVTSNVTQTVDDWITEASKAHSNSSANPLTFEQANKLKADVAAGKFDKLPEGLKSKIADNLTADQKQKYQDVARNVANIKLGTKRGNEIYIGQGRWKPVR